MCRLGPQVETSTGVVKHARADRSVEGLTVGDTIAVRDGRSEAVRIGTAGSRRQPAAASSPTAAGPEVRQNACQLPFHDGDSTMAILEGKLAFRRG